MLTRLADVAVPWVVENVPPAPVPNPLMLCGSHFGLRLGARGYLKRHRWFGSNQLLMSPGECRHAGKALGVYGHGVGGGDHKDRSLNAADARAIMGIDWATRDGVSQALPPAYCEWIGAQLIASLSRP